MAVDLRKRMIPPLSEKCVGNIVWMSTMFADKEEMELKDVLRSIPFSSIPFPEGEEHRYFERGS
ncbi:hypothetical protein RYX36_032363 [Vicia faba]